jgi:hypothetical protein
MIVKYNDRICVDKPLYSFFIMKNERKLIIINIIVYPNRIITKPVRIEHGALSKSGLLSVSFLEQCRTIKYYMVSTTTMPIH